MTTTWLHRRTRFRVSKNLAAGRTLKALKRRILNSILMRIHKRRTSAPLTAADNAFVGLVHIDDAALDRIELAGKVEIDEVQREALDLAISKFVRLDATRRENGPPAPKGNPFVKHQKILAKLEELKMAAKTLADLRGHEGLAIRVMRGADASRAYIEHGKSEDDHAAIVRLEAMEAEIFKLSKAATDVLRGMEATSAANKRPGRNMNISRRVLHTEATAVYRKAGGTVSKSKNGTTDLGRFLAAVESAIPDEHKPKA